MISDITYSLARQPQRAAALFLTSLLPTGFTQNMNNINFLFANRSFCWVLLLLLTKT